MRLVLFCHSLLSDWNHGNAHFLRGIVTELMDRGHDVRVYEPEDAWSVQNLVREQGVKVLDLVKTAYPGLHSHRYTALDLDEALDGADVVLVHEWTDPELVQRIGRTRGPTLLFHDTHHRAVTDPAAMARYDLSGYDGVLAFGAAVQDVYARNGWSRRSWVWHEAADVRVFHPPQHPGTRAGDVVWVGNWGDDERTAELAEFLFEPVRDLQLSATVHGVRYPAPALVELARHGIVYGGWVPNYRVPDVFARYAFTVHVPRRPHVKALPGVPTIRVFEALACGIPLLSAWWNDVEGLFKSGSDYLLTRDGKAMRAAMRMLLADSSARRELALRGRQTILERHTCAHRVDELFAIVRDLQTGAAA